MVRVRDERADGAQDAQRERMCGGLVLESNMCSTWRKISVCQEACADV
jgi:hypothetical protein